MKENIALLQKEYDKIKARKWNVFMLHYFFLDAF
jgi:hypothetical protein